MRPTVVTAAEAVALIPDGATVSISASSGLGCPDKVLAALGERFRATGSPGDLLTLHPMAAGDMYGIKGMDHLAQPGMLRGVFAGSMPSGPSALRPPAIRTMIDDELVEAYNIPTGVMYQMHRAAANKQPGVLTSVGLGTFADPRQGGAKLNSRTPEFVSVEQLAGQEWLFYPAIPVNVAIIRATTADTHGNLSCEHEGSSLGALDQAFAAHNNGGLVIAQVERVSTSRLPVRSVRVPGILVDRIVVAADQMQTTQIQYDPALSGEITRDLHDVEPVEFGLDKVIARRAAMELHREDTVNLGFGISAAVPRVLLEEEHLNEVTWVLEHGAIGGFPLTGFAFGCAINPEAIMSSSDQFTLLQGGGFDAAVLSFLEVSEQGDVNVSHLPARPHVTVGVGGFADITTNARNLIFAGHFTAGPKELVVGEGRLEIRKDGVVPKFVRSAAQITYAGVRARRHEQNVRYVTERAVLDLTPDGLAVMEIAPGVDLQKDVLDRAAIPLRVSPDLRLMDAALFRAEPTGLQLHPPRPERWRPAAAGPATEAPEAPLVG